jgi:hypothetical protein
MKKLWGFDKGYTDQHFRQCRGESHSVSHSSRGFVPLFFAPSNDLRLEVATGKIKSADRVEPLMLSKILAFRRVR